MYLICIDNEYKKYIRSIYFVNTQYMNGVYYVYTIDMFSIYIVYMTNRKLVWQGFHAWWSFHQCRLRVILAHNQGHTVLGPARRILLHCPKLSLSLLHSWYFEPEFLVTCHSFITKNLPQHVLQRAQQECQVLIPVKTTLSHVVAVKFPLRNGCLDSLV